MAEHKGLWLPDEHPTEDVVGSATRHINAPHLATGEDQQAYENLLSALRKDLQLDAATDVQHGTVGIALINDGTPTAASETEGAAAALQVTPDGYLVLRGPTGTVYKLPFYAA